jgi:hypothetical protein
LRQRIPPVQSAERWQLCTQAPLTHCIDAAQSAFTSQLSPAPPAVASATLMMKYNV